MGRDLKEVSVLYKLHHGLPDLFLFVCQRNSAASIMAEAILRQLAEGRLQAASAGEHPASRVCAEALRCLSSHDVSTIGLYTKPWGPFFLSAEAPIRFVVGLADVYATRAAWPTETLIGQWPMEDPADSVGNESDIQRAYETAFSKLQSRMHAFLALPLNHLPDSEVVRQLGRIGERQ